MDRGAAVAAITRAGVEDDPVDERRHRSPPALPVRLLYLFGCSTCSAALPVRLLCVLGAMYSGDGTRADRNRFALVFVNLCRRPRLRPRNDVDDTPTTRRAELDPTRREGEQGVVLATTHVQAGVVVGAALADQDLTGVDQLAAVSLDAEELGVRIAAVTARRRALLVCHVVTLLSGLDAGDLDHAVALTMALPLAVAGFVLVLQDVDLGALGVVDDLGRHRHVAQRLRVTGHRV